MTSERRMLLQALGAHVILTDAEAGMQALLPKRASLPLKWALLYSHAV